MPQRHYTTAELEAMLRHLKECGSCRQSSDLAHRKLMKERTGKKGVRK